MIFQASTIRKDPFSLRIMYHGILMMCIIALNPLSPIPPRPPPRSSPHSNCSLINYFSWVKRGANRPGSQFQNLWEPVSVTEGEILPHLLIAPVTPAGSFARCMVLVLQERRDQLAQILYHDCKNLVSWGASA